MKMTKYFFVVLLTLMATQVTASEVTKVVGEDVANVHVLLGRVLALDNPESFMLKLWGLCLSGLSSFNSQEEAVLQAFFIDQHVPVATVAEINVLMQGITKVVDYVGHLYATATVADGNAIPEGTLKALESLQEQWQKIGRPLIENVYRELYYQALAKDPSYVADLPTPIALTK